MKDFLERPETIKKLWIGLYAACALTLVPEFFITRHPHFGIDGFFGFYALLGFVSCSMLILLAKLGGIFLKKPEDYYASGHDVYGSRRCQEEMKLGENFTGARTGRQ